MSFSFQKHPLGGSTNSTRHWISSVPALPFVSPDPCETIVDRIITFTDRDLFACLCVFKLARNDKWLLNEAANYCLFVFLACASPNTEAVFPLATQFYSHADRFTAALADLYWRRSQRAAWSNQITPSASGCKYCFLLEFWFREFLILWNFDEVMKKG